MKLHPKINERKSPRISASALAEFIISSPDQQDRLLHDQRFSSAYLTPKNQQALNVIRSICTDTSRDWAKYEAAKAALLEKSKGSHFTPSQRDEAARCVETLDLFKALAGNTFGVAGRAFCQAPKFETFEINGLPVSAFPDLVVGSSFPPRDGKKTSLVFIRVQKRPDPSTCKTDATKEARCSHRREVLAYMLVIGDMMLRANGHSDETIDRKKFCGWDVRLGEEIGFPSDRVSREKRIVAACGQISRLWETIEPKPSDLA